MKADIIKEIFLLLPKICQENPGNQKHVFDLVPRFKYLVTTSNSKFLTFFDDIDQILSGSDWISNQDHREQWRFADGDIRRLEIRLVIRSEKAFWNRNSRWTGFWFGQWGNEFPEKDPNFQDRARIRRAAKEKIRKSSESKHLQNKYNTLFLLTSSINRHLTALAGI